jgi:uncharacterized membrane-anchored protein YitT (DUF2179 family)
MSKKAKINWKTESINLTIIFFSSILVGIGLWIFVYHAGFAPSGVDGIVAILNKVFDGKVNPGIFTFAINAPLLIAAWFVLNKKYVIYTIFYTIVISVTLLVLEEVDFYQYVCMWEAGGVTVFDSENSRLLAAVFAGVAQGFTGVMLRLGGSSGGVDVVGSMIQKKMPHKDLEKIIAVVSYIIVAISFFVFDRDVNSVLLAVVEIFVCEKITAVILKSNRNAIRFEIITGKEQAEEIKRLIIFNLRHGATILKGQGAFSEDDKEVIVCVVNYRQLPEFLKLVKKIPNTFLYYSDVMGVRGNFDWSFEDSRPEDIKLLNERIKQEEMKKQQLEAQAQTENK